MVPAAARVPPRRQESAEAFMLHSVVKSDGVHLAQEAAATTRE